MSHSKVSVPPLLALSLIACGEPDPFVGDDVGYFESTLGAPEGQTPPTDSGTSGESARSISGVQSTCDVDGLQGAEPALTLTGVAGGIEVTHTGVDTWCDTEWELLWWAEGANLYVAYTSLAPNEDPTCACAWTLQYTIDDVAPGTYTVETTRGSASVTVP